MYRFKQPLSSNLPLWLQTALQQQQQLPRAPQVEMPFSPRLLAFVTLMESPKEATV